MEKLLKWSVDAAHSGNVGNPDPKLLAQLFGAPGDQDQMREDLRFVVENTDDIDKRVECLEDFEEMVESIDNANEIGTLWEPLLYLVNDREARIRSLSLSAIGSAVQNNAKAQGDLVATKSGIGTIMEHVCEKDSSVVNKALYALASAIGHCSPAYEQFRGANGWDVLQVVFDENFDAPDGALKIRGRVLGLLYAVILADPADALKELRNTSIWSKIKTLEPKLDEALKERITHIEELLNDNEFKDQ